VPILVTNFGGMLCVCSNSNSPIWRLKLVRFLRTRTKEPSALGKNEDYVGLYNGRVELIHRAFFKFHTTLVMVVSCHSIYSVPDYLIAGNQ
jgi:hypothetical protein